MKIFKMNIKGMYLFIVMICLIFIFPFVLSITWSDTSTVFNTGAGVLCVVNSSGSYWIQSGYKVDSFNTCYLDNGINANGQTQTTCCPSSYSCNISSNSCEKINTIDECEDYFTQSACENYNLDMIKDKIESKSSLNAPNFCDEEYVDMDKCVYYGSCSCKWKNNKCISTFVVGNPCEDEKITNQKKCEVVKSDLIDKCNSEGKYILTWEKKLFYPNGSIAPSQSWCTSGSKEYPCNENKKTLPFFGLYNIFLSSIIITLIYYLYSKRN